MERLNSEFIEKIILKGIINDKDFLILTSTVFEPEYFDDPNIAHIFKFSRDYVEEYKNIPSRDSVINSSDTPDSIREVFVEADSVDFDLADGYDFLLNQANDYLKEKAIKRAIIESVEDVEDPDRRFIIQKRIEDAIIKDIKVDLGLNYFNDLRERLRRIFTTSESRIPTYFPVFDELINGGFPPYTFNVLTAKIHGGKCFYNGDITIKLNNGDIKKININNFYKYVYENEYKEIKQMPSLQSFINKHGEEHGKIKFDEWRKKVSKARKGVPSTSPLKGKKMDEFFIGKYGEEEGLKRYNIWIEKQKKNGKKGKGKRTLGYYIKKYGDEEGRRKYSKSTKKRSKNAKKIGFNTLGYYIKKYGDEEGRRKYKEKNEKISDIGRGSLEWFIEKYGDKGKERYDLYIERQKLSSKKCIEYWINKGFTEEEAREKISENQTTFSKKICIEKYGEEEGLKRWKERQEKWQNTLNSKSDEEIERINRAKLCNTLVNNGYSKISQDLFWELHYKIKKDFKDIYFAQLNRNMEKDCSGYNNEYFLKIEEKNIFPDFFIKDKKLIIEFDGDYWHGEARGNQKKDIERDNMIIDAGYKVLHVKERDYNNNQEEVIKKCLDFIYE